MKKTVKLLSVILIIGLIVTLFAGCGKKDRILYNSVDLSEYVELGDYKGVEVDTSSETFNTYFEELARTDANDNELISEIKKGKVRMGDTANINFEGKIDGKTFEGGSGENYDLEIGSNTFIEGFEEGLVGVKIGKTVDLDLKFPDDYHSAEYAGKDVVFTVKVNSVKRPQSPKESYSALGFKTYTEYKTDLTKRAAKQYLTDALNANSKIKEYPKEDSDYLLEQYKNIIYNTQGVSFNEYITQSGITEEYFIENLIEPMMKSQMITYAVIDAENLTIDTAGVEQRALKYIQSMGGTNEDLETVKKENGEFWFEETAASEAVVDFLYNNAKIK